MVKTVEVILLLSICTSLSLGQSTYKDIKDKFTFIDAIVFLRNSPEHEDSEKIRKLYFEKAKEINSIRAYRMYLQYFPEGEYSERARQAIQLPSEAREDVKFCIKWLLVGDGPARAEGADDLRSVGSSDRVIPAIPFLVSVLDDHTEIVWKDWPRMLQQIGPVSSVALEAHKTLVKIGERALTHIGNELKYSKQGYDDIALWSIVKEILQLSELEKHRHWKDRYEVITKLGDFEYIGIVPYMVVALKDQHPAVRRSAAITLSRFRVRYQLEPLIEALSDEDWCVRKNAAFALGEFGDSRAFDHLAGALKDNDAGVRAFAVSALFQVGGRKSIPLIVNMLEDKNLYVRKKAAESLEFMGWKPTTDDVKISCLFANQNWAELIQIGLPAIETLTKGATDNNRWLRWNSIEAIKKIQDREALIPQKIKNSLINAFNSLESKRMADATSLKSPDTNVADENITYLHNFDKNVVNVLQQYLLSNYYKRYPRFVVKSQVVKHKENENYKNKIIIPVIDVFLEEREVCYSRESEDVIKSILGPNAYFITKPSAENDAFKQVIVNSSNGRHSLLAGSIQTFSQSIFDRSALDEKKGPEQGLILVLSREDLFWLNDDAGKYGTSFTVDLCDRLGYKYDEIILLWISRVPITQFLEKGRPFDGGYHPKGLASLINSIIETENEYSIGFLPVYSNYTGIVKAVHNGPRDMQLEILPRDAEGQEDTDYIKGLVATNIKQGDKIEVGDLVGITHEWWAMGLQLWE